ncbi:MAG: patatin-like phospholipase family protein [Flavobacteriaceae bacterium]|nr:patatin-like phospholipase family protein [Flavobacteriaceae bacterium]
MGKQIIYTALFLVTFLTYSQQTIPDKDLKVGLVLSGGGAKGLAHIGALKVLEDSGVRIDYIAGTSMGAIVGALYASGYSADELTVLFKEVNFDKLITDDFQRKNKSFFERKGSDKHAIVLPFNKFKLSLPSAISKGQNSYNFYVKLLDHVKEVDDFSKLPIPFLCIATDVETGKQVLLEKGYLPDAILASGAIPTLFEPVSLNGKLLVDGGVSNNYPIEELLAKNVDIVIGVDVQDSLKKKEELNSASDIMFQLSNFNTQSQMSDKIEKTAVYIRPDIKDYNIVSFDQAQEIYTSGYEAAKSVIANLREIAKKQKLKEVVKVDKNTIEEYYLKSINIQGIENYTRSYILGKLKIKTPSLVSREKIEKGIIGLAATSNFNAVKYKVKNDSILELNIQESKNKTSLRLSLHYDDLYKGAALVNITHKQLLTNNDIVSLDIILGDNIRYDFEYYIDKGFYWSIGLKSRLNSFEKKVNLSIFDNTTPPNIEFTGDVDVLDLTNQFYIETPFRKNLALALGVEHKMLKITAENTGDKIENDNFFSAYGQLNYDALDDIYYPTKGLYFSGDYHQYFFTGKKLANFEQFSIAKAKLGGATKLVKNLYLNAFTEGGLRIGNNTNPSFDFVIGGYGNNLINNYTPFYGYDFLSVAGDGYVKGTIDLHYQFYKKHFFTLSANFANIDDGLFKDVDWLSFPDHTGYALGYGAKTILGPMQIKSTWSPEVKRVQWFVSVGFWF